MSHPALDVRSAATLTAAAACWGLATVLTKSLLASVPPLTLLTLQLLFSTTLLWLLSAGRRQPWPAKRHWFTVGLLGLLNPGISYTLSLIGLTTTTASMSTLLWASEPVLILGLAWLLLREKLSPALITFSATASLGVLLISGLASARLADGQVLGNLLILGGVACCALYTVLARRLAPDTDVLFAVTLQQTFALLWSVSVWPWELRGQSLLQVLSFDASTWGWVVVSGVLYYALAFWFYVQSLTRVSASRAGVFINLIPVFGVAGAYLVLGERLTGLQWLGAGAILLSVLAVLMWPAQPAPPASPV